MTKAPAEYDIDDVCDWLVAIHQPSDVVDKFRENAVDGDMLVGLTMDDLQGDDLGLSKLQAKKLMQQLDFTKELASTMSGASGGGDDDDASTAQMAELEQKVQDIQAENAALKAQIEEYEKAKAAAAAAAAPPPPEPAPRAAPPPPQKSRPRNEHDVIREGAKGAAKGAMAGAIVGAIAGDAGAGAKAGAAAGGALGGVRGLERRRQRRLLR